MSTFLWTLIVFGLMEIGGSMAYLLVNKIPERTRGGVVISLLLWIGLVCWAISLMKGAA